MELKACERPHSSNDATKCHSQLDLLMYVVFNVSEYFTPHNQVAICWGGTWDFPPSGLHIPISAESYPRWGQHVSPSELSTLHQDMLKL